MKRDPDSDDLLFDLNATDDGARAAFRRGRTLTMALSGVAVLAVIVAGGLLVQSMRSTGGGPRTTDTAAAGPTAPTDSAQATLEQTTPTPTPEPTVIPTPTSAARPPVATAPTTQTVPPGATQPVTAAAPQPGADLRVSGPSSVTLQSDGTVYRGQFTLTVTNAGAPYSLTAVYLALPAGVQIDFAPGYPGFAQCLTTAPPYTWICAGNSIPAGGAVTNTVHLKADYAPLATAKTLTGLILNYSAPNEELPGDNLLTLTVELPAAT